ncbi:dihydroxyacetone kinase subunit DhaK [Microbacterium sp. NPDC055910]|uniref:dihydroxyacetone kinase subunit DhaK n=1 Tax=Microbacterium sp. NPDC055910 TaxID=3345659 RepID=UPI0035E26F46
MSHMFIPADPVPGALVSMCAAHGDMVVYHDEPSFVAARAPLPNRRVGLVSGGGSGHEPMHAGFVGQGCLDAAVPGRVFASPHAGQVYAASRYVAKSDGVLHIVKNYTGDLINFGAAMERLRAEGISVERIVVDDDVATDSAHTRTGRRGTGATVVVEKLLGAAADEGLSLAELKRHGDAIIDSSRSVAVASTALTSTSTGEPAFEISPHEVEYGVGIHGERARQTVARPTLDDLVERMMHDVLSAFPRRPERVIVLVNGLGGTTALELHSVNQLLCARLMDEKITVDSVAVGTLASALDMRGFSITFTSSDDERMRWWLTETATPAMPRMSRWIPPAPSLRPTERGSGLDNPLLRVTLARVTAAHERLTALDQATGDGDFGDNLLAGVRWAVSHAADDSDTSGLDALRDAFMDHVGGSSGPLLGLLFLHLRVELGRADSPDDYASATRRAVLQASDSIHRLGGAERGDRTLLDALVPVEDSDGGLLTVVVATASGATATSEMQAARGRASYVGDRALGHVDPGAAGVAVLLGAVAEHFAPAETDEVRAVVARVLD